MMEHFYEDIGEDWFSFQNLYSEMVQRFKENSHFVEIGCWIGRSSSYMAVEIINSGFDIKFDCIDTWEGSVEHKENYLVKNDELFNEFKNNISPVAHKINAIRIDSLTASKLYEDETLDFIFIDASHEYEDVKNDILHWKSKVKKNGVIAGHDFTNSWIEVKRAVIEVFGKEKIIERDCCWVVDMEILNREKTLI
jgi:predicted O-methyltransferase YrrM